MAERVRIAVTGGQHVAAVYARPPDVLEFENLRTLVVMVHDLPGGHKGDHQDLLGLIETTLTLDGIHTLRFDFRGCGESDGKPELTSLGTASRDLEAVLNWAEKTGYKSFILLGEGLGASVAITHMRANVKAAILLWPWLDPREIAETEFASERFAEAKDPPATIEYKSRKVGIRLVIEAARTNLRPFMKKIRVPAMILMGEQDEVVPQEQLSLARKYIPSKRLEINTYLGGQYGLPLESHRKNVLLQIRDFVRKYA